MMEMFTWEDDRQRTFISARRRFVQKYGYVPNRLGVRGEDEEDTRGMGITVVSKILPPDHFFLWREDGKEV